MNAAIDRASPAGPGARRSATASTRSCGASLAGERAAAPLTRFPTRQLRVPLAAPIAGDPAPSRHRRFLRRMGRFALDVALEALRSAVRSQPAASASGCSSAYGGLRAHWDDMMPALARPGSRTARDAWERGLQLLHPFWMLQHLSNNAHALAARSWARGATA